MNRILVLLIIVLPLLFVSVSAESFSTGGPYATGDMIIIQGETNFNTDNRVLVDIYPASFGPARKYDPTMTGGASTVVPVLEQEKGRFTWYANVSTKGWKPDQYMVRAEIIGKDYRETSTLTLSEKNTTSVAPQGTSEHIGSSVPTSISTPGLQETSVLPEQTGLSNKTGNPGTATTPVPTTTQRSPLPAGIILLSVFTGGVLMVLKKR